MAGGFKVDFFIIGAMKSGTTSLYDLLAQHPQISMATEKEPAHFLLEENYELLPQIFVKRWWDEESYRSLFGKTGLRGEASTYYSYPPFTPGIADRIRAHNPEARFIYLARDPVKRLVSHYNFDVRHGLTSMDLDKAVVRHLRYVGISDYALHLAAYRDRFPSENILVLISERFRKAPLETLRRVESFLGVDPMPDPVATESNVAPEISVPPRVPARTLNAWRETKGWKALSKMLPKPVKRRLSRMALYGRARPLGLQSDVPECVAEYLRERAGEFRAMIGDEIPEWDTW